MKRGGQLISTDSFPYLPMDNKTPQELWEEYCAQELVALSPILKQLGYNLEAEQPHLGGERYLMQAVTTKSGKKLVLLGHRTSDKRRVVVKATRDPKGTEELQHERACREILQKINFAYQAFSSPEELLFTRKSGFTITTQEFIEQEKPFLERPTKEQFTLALKAFKAQESAHATTYRHLKLITKVFPTVHAKDYLAMSQKLSLPAPALQFLTENQEMIEQYCGFLTHIDFVPHNFRIKNGNIYLLDHSSLRFGNKYEGWARFLNFMTLYNPELEEALTQYVRDNRTAEEVLSLKCMRVYRLGEIIWYYQNTLSKSSGDLLELNRARVIFWSLVLASILKDEKLSSHVREEYIKNRDELRSDAEKCRQSGLH
ncbi:MAG: hypothetical protein Q8P58_01335 [Candidatus Adlerbacteria bacterium]|nr:hypothetical protein [Candidatus Adlerbacteria bacterium]